MVFNFFGDSLPAIAGRSSAQHGHDRYLHAERQPAVCLINGLDQFRCLAKHHDNVGSVYGPILFATGMSLCRWALATWGSIRPGPAAIRSLVSRQPGVTAVRLHEL